MGVFARQASFGGYVGSVDGRLEWATLWSVVSVILTVRGVGFCQEDDEATLEADEALITEAERKEELSALQRESELPLEDLLNAYKLMRGRC